MYFLQTKEDLLETLVSYFEAGTRRQRILPVGGLRSPIILLWRMQRIIFAVPLPILTSVSRLGRSRC